MNSAGAGMEMNCKWDIDRGKRYFHAVTIGPEDDTNGFAHEEYDPYELLDADKPETLDILRHQIKGAAI